MAPSTKSLQQMNELKNLSQIPLLVNKHQRNMMFKLLIQLQLLFMVLASNPTQDISVQDSPNSSTPIQMTQASLSFRLMAGEFCQLYKSAVHYLQPIFSLVLLQQPTYNHIRRERVCPCSFQIVHFSTTTPDDAFEIL